MMLEAPAQGLLISKVMLRPLRCPFARRLPRRCAEDDAVLYPIIPQRHLKGDVVRRDTRRAGLRQCAVRVACAKR